MSDTLQGDWEWIVKVLQMSVTRVADGQRVTLYRPDGWSKSVDIRKTAEAAIMTQVSAILSTAEVVDAEP
jgi:hypothetical protein